MKQLKRLISADEYKGTRNYLKTQKKYELAKTLLLFGISSLLLFLGVFSTGTKMNLLTIIAVLGCLPASKSLVIFIMFCRYSGLREEMADQIQEHVGELTDLYDMIFTGREKNYVVSHLVIKGNTVCGFSQEKDFDETGFVKHVTSILKADSLSNVSVKIFRDLSKYLARLDQMQALECDQTNTGAIKETLKSVSL